MLMKVLGVSVARWEQKNELLTDSEQLAAFKGAVHEESAGLREKQQITLNVNLEKGS